MNRTEVVKRCVPWFLVFALGFVVCWVVKSCPEGRSASARPSAEEPTRITVLYPDSAVLMGHRFRSLIVSPRPRGAPHEVQAGEWVITLLFGDDPNQQRSVVYVAE